MDLVVIGLGSAGLTAAALARRDLGLSVVAVERARVGGDCLWTGCVPSKVLAHAGRLAHTVTTAAPALGLSDSCAGTTPPSAADRARVWAHLDAVRVTFSEGEDSPEALRTMGVDLIEGEARITGGREVTVRTAAGTERVVTTRYILVCTGARPSLAPIAGLADTAHLTTDTLFDAASYPAGAPPEDMVIVGAGPVAAESAQALARLGVRVTLIGRSARLLPAEEPELSERLAAVLRAEGVQIHLGTTVGEIQPAPERGSLGARVIAGDLCVDTAAVLIATGRTPNVDGLGLDRFGIPVSAAGIAVDHRSRTLVPTIYVVGDAAAGRDRSTHTAAQDAAMAVRDMFFPGRGTAATLSPRCTYTDPELASVGLTAAAAREAHPGRRVQVHRHEFTHNDRARTEGRTEGALILITVRGRLVGAHCLGPHAGETIHPLAMAVATGLRLRDLTRFVHLYPTYATSIAQVAGAATVASFRRLRALARLGRYTG